MILIWLSCAWITGNWLGSKLNLPPPLILIGLAPLAVLFFTRRRKPAILASAAIMLLITASIYSFASLNTVDESHLRFYNDRSPAKIKGTVSEAPDVRDKNTRLLLSVKEIRLENGWREVDGKALVFVPRYPAYKYGDLLKVNGIPTTPQQFDDFDYREYLAHQGIYTVFYYPSVELLDTEKGLAPLAWIYSLREGISENLAEILPEPQASLAQGIILGIRGNIAEELRENFAASGTAHLLAISGLHLGIMAGILLATGILLFGKRYYLYVWLAIGAIWCYAVITGAHLPVVRGAIMATLFLLAELLGRQHSAIVALTFAAAVMVGVSPYILGDASFQLSFLAMAGLVFIFPILRNAGRDIAQRTFGDNNRVLPAVNAVIDAVSATLGALLAVWPVVAYYFGIVSLAAPLATLLALPALPMVIVIGALAGVTGFASLAVAQGFGWLAWLFLSYMLMVVNGLAAPAISAIETGPVSPVFIGIYYAVLAGAVWVHGHRGRLFRRFESEKQPSTGLTFRLPRTVKWIIVPLIATAVLTVYTAATMPDDKLHVSFLDVGEGDAILIQKGSRQVLVDGGPSPQAIGLELGKQMPYWDRTIDLLVLTHPHSDHMTGLVEVIRRYRVTGIMEPDCEYDSPMYREWHRIIEEKGIAITTARAGLIIDMGDGIIIEVLSPTAAGNAGETPDLDNNSAVLRLTAGDISFLLTGDIMRETERELVRQGTAAGSNVLKAGHHGSDTSSTAEFLAAVDPDAAVISCGRDNKHGHPSDEVLARLERETGAGNIYRTDEDGTIEFTTDGERLWVETER